MDPTTPTTNGINLTQAQVIANLQAVLSTAFQAGFEGTTVAWQKFAMQQPFDAAGLALGWLGQIPDLRQWIGERVLGVLNAYAYLIKPLQYEATLGFTVSELNDSIIANMAMAMRAIGEAAARHPQKLLINLINNGTKATLVTTNDNVAFDGQPFFSAAHPVIAADGTAGTYSNISAAGGAAPWYLVRGDGNGESSVIKPFVFGIRTSQGYQVKVLGPGSDLNFMRDKNAIGVDARVVPAYGLPQFAYRSTAPLTSTSFEAGLAAMDKIVGDNGAFIENTPNLLLVSPSNRFAAENIVNRLSFGAAGDNIDFKRVEIMSIKTLQDVPDAS